MAGEQGLPISEVSRLLGIPVPTIRSWERRYGFPSPARTRGRHRRYTDTEIDALERLRDEISRGHRAGDAVRRIRERSPRAREALAQDALDAMLRMDPTGLRSVLDEALERFGPEKAIQSVALPFMHAVGDRWRVGECDTAHEHLATDVVRAWIGRLRAMAASPRRADPVILACGPKEQHTIGLEAFGVFLARRGWGCRTLGASTPTASIVRAAQQLGARAVVVSAQRGVMRRSAVEAITAAAGLGGTSVFYAGAAFSSPSSRRGLPGTHLGDDLEEAADLFEAQVA